MLEKVRGLPKKFPSDNAKTFKTAAKTIDSVLLKDEDVKSYLLCVGVGQKNKL